MATFFTADTHFGDVLILGRRGRFASAAEHDGALITRWNETIGPEDEVWYLGGFAAGASRARCAEIFAGLNGIKRLIRGNHDTNRVLNLPWADPPLERARYRPGPMSGFTLRTTRTGPGRACSVGCATSMATPTRCCPTPAAPAT